MIYRILADLVLVIHAGFIAFVVVGLVLILIGGALGWRWVGNRWFRGLHLACIGIVVIQAWFDIPCSLTVWENNLRAMSGQSTYPGGFIAYWVRRVIFYEGVPDVIFLIAYTGFGLLVALALWLVPVRWRGRRRAPDGGASRPPSKS